MDTFLKSRRAEDHHYSNFQKVSSVIKQIKNVCSRVKGTIMHI